MPAAQAQAKDDRKTACYIYGIVPADVEMTQDAHGLNNSDVELVRHRDIGALVSNIEIDRPIGKPKDLAAHEQLLDTAAVEVPVLPLRFGAVMTSRKAVAEELLAPHHEEFSNALREMEGRAEYVVKARYRESAVLGEILRENQEAARLREEVRGKDEIVVRDANVRLGEIIQRTLEKKREKDARELIETLTDCAVAAKTLQPTHEMDSAQIAFLVDHSAQSTFDSAVDGIATRWKERANIRLLGPLAPYDFVVTAK